MAQWKIAALRRAAVRFEALVRFNGKGLASFLQKPFTISSLNATMQLVLEGKDAAQPDGQAR